MTDNGPGSQVWERVRVELRGIVGEATYASWLKSVEFRRMDNGVVTLTAPTRFDCKEVDQKFGPRLKEIWTRHAPEARKIVFEVADEAPRTLRIAAESVGARDKVVRRDAPTPLSLASGGSRNDFSTIGRLAGSAVANTQTDALDLGPMQSIRLNELMTFDRFVESRSNRAALDAARQVAEQDVVTMNPLMICGASGSGKTHLANAIVRRFQERRPDANVLHITAETFIEHFVSAIQNRDMARFKAATRNVDMLVVDDFYHIIGKVKSEEEFRNAIAVLIDEGRQVVIASDKAPNEMKELNFRLLSRLRDGVLAMIQPADVELRRAVLQQKAELAEVATPDLLVEPEALDFLAERLGADLRELMGSFNRVALQARVEGRPLSAAFAKGMLGAEFRERERRFTMDEICRIVIEHFDMRPGDLESSCRERHIVRPRQIAMWMCRRLAGRTFPEIGRRFGGRNHATVIHAVDKVDALRASDPDFNDEVERVRRKIENGDEQ